MKILQINKYHYVKGGSETVFFNTIKLLEENGHEVHRFCLKDEQNLPCRDEPYFVDYPEMSSAGFFQQIKNSFSFFYNRKSKRKIEQLIKDIKPDIVHIHLLFNGISVSILPVLKKYNIPVVMSVHDYRLICPAYLFLDGNGQLCERCYKGTYLNCIKHKCHNNSRFSSAMLALDMYFRNIFIPVSKYVSQFIFVSQFTYSKHLSYTKVFLERGYVLPNFVDNIPIKSNKSYPEEKYYLFYGRLSREKGLLTLIHVCRKLNIKLKIVGKGPLFEYKDKIEAAHVEWLGFKSGAELYELVRNAYFVVVPSECYETFGLTVIESLFLGTPVIGANIGAISELITDNENGFLFEPGSIDHLSQTIAKANSLSPAVYLSMSESALKKSLLYSDTCFYYNNLIKIYEQAITECQNPPYGL